MKAKNADFDSESLRQKAEAILPPRPPPGGEVKKRTTQLSEAATLKLIHELQVHKVELELQNIELIQAKEKADEAAGRYAELYFIAPSGYFTLNRESKIAELNLFGSQMLGKERSLIKNSYFHSYISKETKPDFYLFLERVFSSSVQENCEVTLNVKNAEPLFVYLTGKAFSNKNECLVNAINITARRQAEQKLIIANTELANQNEKGAKQLVELATLNAEKDKFFSIIAHDLRSPFSSFLGLTQILVENLHGLTPQEIQLSAQLMRNSATHLFSLLENILEWSRMHRGLTVYEPASILLSPLALDSLVLSMQAAKEKEIEVINTIPVDILVFADKSMLKSIMRNLVNNAIKFTPRNGSIKLSANQLTGNRVEISVSDTGIGIPANILEKLFRLDGDVSRKGTEGESSTGLGLIICKDFIEKQEGEFWVESLVGKGSTFLFTLPGSKG